MLALNLSQSGREVQLGLFGPQSDEERERKGRVMTAVDRLNSKLGRDTVHLASAGFAQQREWKMRQALPTPHYTTKWSQILSVKG